MATFQPVNEQLGYCFHPPAAAHDIGHPQLDVIIRPAPTGEHFDPESMACLVAAASGTTPLHVTHPWQQETAYRVCAGDLSIEDFRHAHVAAFTFGGTLRIESDSRRTICQLSSPAPLLEHARQTLSLEEQLIEEVAILFAERRAAQDEDAFDQRLAAAEPALLYHACLKALRDKFEQFPVTDEANRRFQQFLRTATQALEGENIPLLTELL